MGGGVEGEGSGLRDGCFGGGQWSCGGYSAICGREDL